MQHYSAYHHPTATPSSPNALQSRANLRSCLRQGNFSSNRSTRSTRSAVSSNPPQSRGDVEDDRTARSAPTVITTSSNSLLSINDTEERQFMKLANLLVTHHQSSSDDDYSTIQSTRQLLHYYIPSAPQRLMFLQSLRRNRALLPMFPEPNESSGYALTRYVDRVFGPLLERECNNNVELYPSGGGPRSPMRMMQSTRRPSNNNHGSTSAARPIPSTTMESPILNVPSTPLEGRNDHHHHSMLFPSPNHSQQQPREHFGSSPNNMSSPPPMECTTNNNNSGPMLFPPPNSTAGRNDHRMPPPSPMGLSTSSNPIHSPSPHHHHHHVSFPMYSSPDTSFTRNNNLPRPHHTTTPPAAVTTTNTEQPSPSLSFASPKTNNNNHHRPLTIGEELNKSSNLDQEPPLNLKSLLNNTTSSTDTTASLEGLTTTHLLHYPDSNAPLDTVVSAATSRETNVTGINDDSIRRSKGTTATTTTTTPMGYQKFTNEYMLPPITPRENILYHLPKRGEQGDPSSSSCCSGEPPRAKRKRPSYLQVYVKCERSEPYLQPSESMDIVTWYRNGNNQVTADRTLVVRGTTSLLDLIGGIIEAFGLFSDHSDACMKANTSSPLLMAYKDICFMSDVKSTQDEHTGETTTLTPLPIPGFYYKYVDREVHGRLEMEKESLLSTDPVVLQRTLVAQVLDKPLYQSKKKKSGDALENTMNGGGTRTRLALVYCAPKRDAYVSPRTQKGVLPETIYHFQLLLDGIVPEEDLPSSFTSQTAIRCVGSTGGVAGGSLIDSVEEIEDLNRTFWGVNDVIGLVNPTADPQRNLEQIIDVLGVPLFDNVGNQTLKEMLLDRCLYHIYSGNLSHSMAKKTQRTVEKMQGTSQWLAKGVEAFFAKGITSCVEDNVLFGGDELEVSLSRLSVSSSKSQTRAQTRRKKSSKRLHNR